MRLRVNAEANSRVPPFMHPPSLFLSHSRISVTAFNLPPPPVSQDNYTFYPASGKTSSILGRNPIINIPIAPMWRCPQAEPGVAGAVGGGLKASVRSRRAYR